MTKDEIARSKDVMDLVSEMRSNKNDKISRWDTALQQYENRRENIIRTKSEDGVVSDISIEEDDDLARIHLPTLYSIIDTKYADEVKAPFDVKFIPRNKESKKFAEIRKRVFEDVWIKIKGEFIRNRALLQKSAYGDSFIQIGWKMIEGFKTDPKVVVENGQKTISTDSKKSVMIYDDIYLENVPPREMLIDPAAKFIYDAMYAARDRYISKYKALQLYGDNPIFKNVEKGLNAGNSGDTDTMSPGFFEDTAGSDIVNVVDFYSLIDDTYTILLNGIEIYKNSLPVNMIPFVHYKNRQTLEDLYSLSEYDVVGDVINEKNFHRNVIKEASLNHISPAIMMGGNAEFDNETYEFGIGRVWQVGDINQVKPLVMGDLPSAPFRLEQEFDRDIIRGTGIDYNSMVDTGTESATKTVTRQRTQLKRVEAGLRFNSMYADNRLVNLIMDFVDRYYTLPQVSKSLDDAQTETVLKYRTTRVMNEEIKQIENDRIIEFLPKDNNIDFFDIRRELIGSDGEFDVVISTAENLPLSREIEEQKLIEFLQIMNTAQLDPQTGKLLPHIEPIIRRISELQNVDSSDFDGLFAEESDGNKSSILGKLQEMGISVPQGEQQSAPQAGQQQQTGRPPLASEARASIGQRSITDNTNPRSEANRGAQNIQQSI